MSNIKHCDRHDADFSVREEGWSEWRGTVHGKYNDGSANDQTESLDFCAACTAIMRGARDVTDPISGRNASGNTRAQAQIQNAKDRNYDPDYVAWLESQNGVTGKVITHE